MSDSDTSNTSFDSNSSSVLTETNNNIENPTTDFQESSERNVTDETSKRKQTLICLPKGELSKVLKINSPVYNLILNNQVKFPFDTPIGTPNSEEPTLDIMEQLMARFAWQSDSYQEHTGLGDLRTLTIYSGTIHQVALWSSQKMHAPCLFEITAQLVGIAKKDPSQPNCKGNEINLLIRDLVKRDPVIQVTQPFYLYSQLPKLTVGQMVRCVGVMLDSHQMQALKITIASYVCN